MEALTQFIPLLIILAACVVGIYSIRNVPIKDNQFHYAGFWMRLFAGIIDAVIVGIITIIPAIGLGYLVGSSMAGSAAMYEIEAVAQGLGNLLGIFVGWIYFATMESSNYQATMGKKLLGLQVVGTDGDQISFGKASGRHFGKIISLLILGIGYFMIGWTKQKQGLHDKMADCLVIRADYDGEANEAAKVSEPRVQKRSATSPRQEKSNNAVLRYKGYKMEALNKTGARIRADGKFFMSFSEAQRWIDDKEVNGTDKPAAIGERASENVPEVLDKSVGETINVYQGYNIVKEKHGVSVDGKGFLNSTSAKNWIDINLEPKVKPSFDQKNSEETESQKFRSSMIEMKELSQDPETENPFQSSNNIQRSGSSEITEVYHNEDEFALEALKRFRRGELSEAALMEIIKPKS